jgi:hypothetical protein
MVEKKEILRLAGKKKEIDSTTHRKPTFSAPESTFFGSK